MLTNRGLLSHLLLPLLSLLALTLVFGSWSLISLKQAVISNHQLTSADLQVIEKAAELSQDLVQANERLLSSLKAAKSGEMNELQLYRQHSVVVDQLADMQTIISEMSSSALLIDINSGTAELLREAFNNYRRFAIMATDIVAVDPSTAADYLNQAEYQFIQFSDFTSRINQLLATRTLERAENTVDQFNATLRQQLLAGSALLLVMLLLAWVSLRLVATKLLLITRALTRLANAEEQLPRLKSIERLAKSSRGEFKKLATALLAFRDSEKKRLAAEQENYRLAYYDKLTGLANRSLLKEQLEQSLQRVRQQRCQGALILIDIDHFKLINESLGSLAGDQLLQKFAERLNTFFKPRTPLGRLSGDEFLVILDDLDPCQNKAAQQLQSLVEKLQQELIQPFALTQQNYRATFSFGLVLFDPLLDDPEDLLNKSQAALHQSKSQGGNRFSFFDPSIQAQASERVWLLQELEMAIDNQQLELHYQLQVGPENQPLGAEALLRWKHPERGYISPGVFIPLAEESGLIIPIGRWVLETACQQLKLWEAQPATANLTLAVNISAKQFQKSDLVTEIRQLLQETQINPQKLKLELTESAVLEQVDITIDRMLELKKLGLTFSMDDFGTGYSSLQYLKRLPLDQLKIDQSFVRDLPDDLEGAAIVETIIAMGLALQLQVIAEGVETLEQQEFLLRHNCRAFQGYLFAKPQPAEDLTQRLTPRS